MSSFKSIGGNFILLAASQVIEKMLSFFVAIYLARYLGKGDYGRLVYAIAFAGLLTFFWDFGLGRLIIRDVAKNRSDASIIFSSKFKFQILSCTAGVLVLSIYLILFEIRYLEGLLILIFGMYSYRNLPKELIPEIQKTLNKKRYFRIERLLSAIASKLEVSLGEMDLYLWCMKTGKVLK